MQGREEEVHQMAVASLLPRKSRGGLHQLGLL